MKKLLALLLMASAAEGSFSSSAAYAEWFNQQVSPHLCKYGYLKMMSENSEIRKKCLNEKPGTLWRGENERACDFINNYIAIRAGIESGWFADNNSKTLDDALNILVDATRKDNELKYMDLVEQELVANYDRYTII